MADKELENPDNWDFNAVKVHPAVKSARAIVSVAFSREDYELVSLCAESSGQRISEFIREAALEYCYTHI